MISTKRTAILALSAVSLAGLATTGSSGSASAAATGTATQELLGTTSNDLTEQRRFVTNLDGSASTCLNAATGEWKATWTVTAEGFKVYYREPDGTYITNALPKVNEDLGVTLTNVTYAGVAPVTETDVVLKEGIGVGRQFATMFGPDATEAWLINPLMTRKNVLVGTSSHAGYVPVTQTIDYSVVSQASHEAPVGVTVPLLYPAGKLAVTIDSPCVAPTPTTTPPPTTPPAATVPAGSSRFVSVTPDRIFDTRSTGKAAANSTTKIPVLGKGGVPATNVKAIVLNVTGVDATDAGFLTVYPSGVATVPDASNLNLAKGQTAANLVTVPVGNDGSVSVYSQNGAHLLADVVGYYEGVTGPVTGGRFVPLTPDRFLDTRPLTNMPGANEAVDLKIGGVKGVPSTGVDSVVLNVTATGASEAQFVTVWGKGKPKPGTSNLNLSRIGETRANQVIVPLGTDGSITLMTDRSADLLVDVAGYFTSSAATSSTAGLFIPIAPSRALDTRGSAAKPAAGAKLDMMISGQFGMPTTGVAAVAVNATAVDGTTVDFVTTWPAGVTMPDVSTLNIDVVGQTVPNHATTPLSAGKASIFTHGGAHLLVDVLGWYTA